MVKKYFCDSRKYIQYIDPKRTISFKIDEIECDEATSVLERPRNLRKEFTLDFTLKNYLDFVINRKGEE